MRMDSIKIEDIGIATILSFVCLAGVELSQLLLRSIIGQLHQPWLIDGDDCRAVSGINYWWRKPKY
jgi:hypothetical protein